MKKRAGRCKVRDAHGLTRRQAQVLGMIMRGLETKQIAHELGIAERTVKTYRCEMLEVSGTPNAYALCVWATWRGYSDEFRPPSESQRPMLGTPLDPAAQPAAGGGAV